MKQISFMQTSPSCLSAFPVSAQLLSAAIDQRYFPLSLSDTSTQSAKRRSEKGHLCLPGLPGDEEKAVIGGIYPVGASLADHHTSPGVSSTAVAPVMLQKTKSMKYDFITTCSHVGVKGFVPIKGVRHLPEGVHLSTLRSL